MNPYACVIVNPAAGAGKTGKAWPVIREVFSRQGLKFEHAVTEGPGHAMQLVAEAVGKGHETVVSVGGDGTIHEIVNGLHRAGAREKVLVGLVSTGTGSDYIRTVGTPRNYRDACARLMEPRTRCVDLGVVDYGTNGSRGQRIFVNFAGLGFDAEIVRRTKQQFKTLGGLPSYLLGAITTLATFRNKDIVLKIDGEATQHRVCTVIMNNGRYGGGGMNTAPNAELDDGLFDVLIVGDISKTDFIYSLPRLYRGTHLTHKKILLNRAREIEITSRNGHLPLQADGELLGEAPATFNILPKALKVIL